MAAKMWKWRLACVLRGHHLRLDRAFETARGSTVDILVIIIICTTVEVSRSFVFLRAAVLYNPSQQLLSHNSISGV